MRWKLTVRSGPRVQRYYFDDLAPALDALERRAQDLSESAPREALDAKFKRFDAVQRVSARLEVAGPERFVASVRGGVDIRGDGSAEPYRGRVRRQVIQEQRGESAYAALRRELQSAGESDPG